MKMNRIPQYFLILAAGVVIGAGAAWFHLGGTRAPGPKPLPAPAAEARKEKKILFYRHPMNPQVTSPGPQKDEMGMDYVPVYEEEERTEAETPGTVRISPEKIQKIGVKSEEAQRRTLKRTIRTVGTVDHDEASVFTINAKVGGWVEKLYVTRTDQMVHPGDPLLELYSPELIATQEEYLVALRARARLKDSPSGEIKNGAEDLVQASRMRLKYWDIGEREIKRIEDEGTISRTLAIYAPAHGIVTEKMVNDGMKIEAGETLFKIIDHSRVWVYGEVFEYELPFVKVGQRALITPSYAPSEVYTATVAHIYTHLGGVRHEAEGGMEETRTVKIRFELPNPGHRLKLGMYVNVELAVDVAENALAVPDSAVINTGAKSVVIVDRGEGRFEPREVLVGGQADGYYHIVSGIKAGERVVTSGNFLIDSEASFSAAMKGMKGH
ncbi:MAG: efflux RND transporter periplasmic adaptor subunit [Deltaproteobacteria bacterium]|nr:efflux RND transporter periplasmic adaptor subunit [Deltaproteobacteria bacterium]